MPSRCLILALFLNLISLNVFAGEIYKIDSEHSSINFVVPHLVISKVSGHFGSFNGEILYEPGDLAKSWVEVKIRAHSINTDSRDRDQHLRGPEFFDAAQYPEINFKSLKIEQSDRLSLCRGLLTMHGVSREIDIPFQVLGKIKDQFGQERIAVEGTAILNRQDFGISWNKLIDGGVLVGNEVRVNLSIEAVKSNN